VNSPIDHKTLNASARTSNQHRLILGKFGRLPKLSLQAMDGYGLSDEDIGQYFKVTPSSIRRLKRALDVTSGIAASH
jgi:hypothetical protein